MATGGRNAKEIAVLNSKIVRDRLKKMSWAKIAERNGVTERHARHIWAKHRDERKPFWRNRDPVEYVFEVLDHYETAMETLGEAAELARDQRKIREEVASTKAMLDAQREMTELMQAVGMLPKNLGKLQIELDWRFTMKVILEIFDKYRMPDQAKTELVAALRGDRNN